MFWRYQKEEYKIIALLNWVHYCVMSISLTKEFEKDKDWFYIIPIEFLDDFIDTDLLQIMSIYSIWIKSFMKTWTLSIIRNLSIWWYSEQVVKDYINIIQSYKMTSSVEYDWSKREEIVKWIYSFIRSEKVMNKIIKKLSYLKKSDLKEFLQNTKMIWVKFNFK